VDFFDEGIRQLDLKPGGIRFVLEDGDRDRSDVFPVGAAEGVAVAAVISSVVLGTFGYQTMLPHMSEFREAQLAMVEDTTGFTIPTSEEKAEEIDFASTVKKKGQQFWDFVVGRESGIEHRIQAIGIGSIIAGLFLGVLAVRWAMVLATSLIGTVLVTSGVATLLSSLFPGSYQSFLSHPQVAALAVGVFLTTSLALQTSLTRKSSSGEEGSQPAS